MIFVCLGSREYQFNRLLEELDKLVGEGKITDEIYAQIGQSTYIPTNYKFQRFMSVVDFKYYQKEAKLVISHGGTGALIGALKLKKQVLAVPRLAKYEEHIDDHQTEVAGVLADEGYLRMVIEIDGLFNNILMLKENPIKKTYNKPSKILHIISDFIENNH